MKTLNATNIRWMRKDDFKFLKEIDENLNKNFLIKFISRKNSICYVLEFGNKIVGFVFFKFYENSIKINKIAIKEEFRKKGFASLLLSKIKSKVNNKRNVIFAFVSEWDLDSQLFFKKSNFFAVSEMVHNDEIFLKFSYEELC